MIGKNGTKGSLPKGWQASAADLPIGDKSPAVLLFGIRHLNKQKLSRGISRDYSWRGLSLKRLGWKSLMRTCLLEQRKN
jgi:hypothetical protein